MADSQIGLEGTSTSQEQGRNRMHKTMLVGVVAATMYTGMIGVGRAEETASTPASGAVKIHAEKMCCAGCARKVSGQLYTVKGVKSVGVDLPTHTVTVSVPQQNPAVLGALWHATQQGEGGPRKLATSAATYELILPETKEQSEKVRQMGGTQQVKFDKLHCKGCANKVAAQLYTVKGVSKVSIDMQNNVLTVTTQNNAPISPWLVIEAALKAKERPVAVSGNFGTLTIEWNTPAAAKNHQAYNPTSKDIQR